MPPKLMQKIMHSFFLKVFNLNLMTKLMDKYRIKDVLQDKWHKLREKYIPWTKEKKKGRGSVLDVKQLWRIQIKGINLY